jgi:hypothetical protein
MYGVPSDHPLYTKLLGSRLIQVCVGEHDLQLHFQDTQSPAIHNVSVTCPVGFSVAGSEPILIEQYPTEAAALLRLLGGSIARCEAIDSHTLGVWFGDGSSVTLHEDATNYECFTIGSDGELLVV